MGMADLNEISVRLQREAALAEPAGSADWDITLCANVVASCRQQIEKLRMKMPMNVAIALGEADRALADAQAWMRAESNFGTYANPPNSD
jgi:hypothetical protein